MTESNSTTIVIFGASGDLTVRKLIPALYHLYIKERLPQNLHVVGLARTQLTNEEFREKMHEGVKKFAGDQYDPEKWASFSQALSYYPFDLNNPEEYTACRDHVMELEDGAANRLYYLATAPRFFPIAIQHMGEFGMVDENGGWRRVIIEKPFGIDLESAQALNKTVHKYLNESQIYRIDHYLAKETVQNILVFRFANTIFEPLWNRNYIDHVQITAAETVDVGHRGGYYDGSGVLRDMFQNHLLQLFAYVAMEAPASFDADALRNEKVKALTAVRHIHPEKINESVVAAQYKGYLEADQVDPNSRTPTYVALRLFIDNWRWHGVPFFLRSGKAMKMKSTEIVIQFKTPPHVMFPMEPGQEIRPNILSIRIQPDEGIHLQFEAKVPDTAAEMRSVDMNFHYAEDFASTVIPEAYERLLLNALNGEAALFTRADGIERAWRIIDPVLKGIENPTTPIYQYQPGTWGPAEADEFLARDHCTWICADE